MLSDLISSIQEGAYTELDREVNQLEKVLLKTGYLTKPFHSSVLQNTIKVTYKKN